MRGRKSNFGLLYTLTSTHASTAMSNGQFDSDEWDNFATPMPTAMPSAFPTQRWKGYNNYEVSLDMAAKLNSADEDHPMPIEYLVEHSYRLHVGYRHVLFTRGKNHLQDNFLNYYSTVGIVSALMLGVSVAAVTAVGMQNTSPSNESMTSKRRRLQIVFLSLLLLSSTFSAATIMLSTVYYIRFSSCVEMVGIVDFLVRYPVNAPDYLNTIAATLFAISLCMLAFLLLPKPWSRVVGGMCTMLLLSLAASILWMVIENKRQRDEYAYHYFDQVDAALAEGFASRTAPTDN